ncbi:SGNH hydrolase domain-containing protein [Nocardioides sp.]|uniref:SGNH hydrolase domain-containing protein n=1 Tax=Nocardioides sp. TaxID=35761 RepID=UPI002B26B522|nr:SGNH hydrolase domain-containing protein [Nocardioides sp.]
MNARPLPPFVAALLSALALALTTSVLVGLTAAPAQAVKPKNDHPTMPRSCVDRADLIPQEPTLCELNSFDGGRPTVLLWGDSHAWQMIPGLRRAGNGKDVNLVAIVMGGCPPMDNALKAGEPAPKCYQANDLAIDYTRDLVAAGKGHRVLLAASWQRYRQALKDRDRTYTGEMARASRKATPRLMSTLADLGASVDVVGQVATVPAARAKCAKSNQPYACNLPRNRALADSVGTKRYLTKLMKPLDADASLINVNGFFCKGKVCRGMVGKTYTWWDDLHISASMSRKLHGFLKPTVVAADASRPGEPSGQSGCSLPLPILC